MNGIRKSFEDTNTIVDSLNWYKEVLDERISKIKNNEVKYISLIDFRYKNENSVREKGMSQNDFKLALSKIQAIYIEDVLPDRTYEKWGYEQVPQSNISGNDFPIGVR